MLNFSKPYELFDGSKKYISTNAIKGYVEIVEFQNDRCQAHIEYFADSKNSIDGKNTFKTAIFKDFVSAKNWAETQISQEVTFSKGAN